MGRVVHSNARPDMKHRLAYQTGLFFLSVGALSACGDDDKDAVEPSPDAGVDVSADATIDEDTSEGVEEDAHASGPACFALDEACTVDTSVQCGRLFGRPSDLTGLPADVCAPECACGDGLWSPPAIEDSVLDALRSFELTNPPERMLVDPYLTPDEFVEQPDRVCGVLFDEGDATLYSLETFDSPEAAREAGAQVTHFGACGLCSSLQDLAVYIAIPDLTQPVRECGIEGLVQGPEVQLDCLRGLGFTEPCADIWSYNTSHTGEVCRSICLPLLSAPYHNEDGSPNDCIQCDEDLSGPVFKPVAGRTRRNSGLPTALCRPCSDVRPVDHRYGR